MSKVLSILERLGQDAELKRVGSDALARALGDMELDCATLTALVGGDAAPLATMLGASSNVVCGLFPGKDDGEESPDKDEESPDKDEESPDKDEPGESPDREENPNVSIRRIAVRANHR